MEVSIPKDQQKVFVEQFMKQALEIALELVSKGKDLGSPGETMQSIGHAIMRQIHSLNAQKSGERSEHADDGEKSYDA